MDAHLAPTIDFMNARGLTHFDTHFYNVVTRGARGSDRPDSPGDQIRVRRGTSIMPFFRKTEVSDPDLEAMPCTSRDGGRQAPSELREQ